MKDYQSYRKTLQSEGESYSEEEAKLIIDLLWSYAQMTVDLFINKKENLLDETSHSYVKGKFG